MIKFLFKDRFIPTWDNELKINDEYAPCWPLNSPDLSPIYENIIEHIKYRWIL